MLAYLRLVRAGALFSPAADVVAGLALAGMPWSAVAVRACLASVLIYAGGMALNDHSDRHTDSRVRPERPIPSGAIPPSTALLLGGLLLLGGVGLSPIPHWHALLAALVLVYDYGCKAGEHPLLELLGALTMGTLRGLNLLTGATLAATATAGIDGWWPATAEWPALLTPTGFPHLYAAAAYAIAIVCITVLGIYEDRKSIRPQAVRSLLTLAPTAWLVAVLATAGNAVAPALAGVALVVFMIRNRKIETWDSRTIRGAMLWLLLGTTVYDALLCIGRGRWPEGLAILATVPLARWIARTIAPT